MILFRRILIQSRNQMAGKLIRGSRKMNHETTCSRFISASSSSCQNGIPTSTTLIKSKPPTSRNHLNSDERRISFNTRFYSTNSANFDSNSSSNPNHSSSSHKSSPLSISLLISTLTLTCLVIYNQSSTIIIRNESQFEKPTHNQPGQDEFGDVNPSVLKGDGAVDGTNGLSMGDSAILTQQEIMRERTRMLGVCAWGSNRYNVAAPDQPHLNVIKNPRWIPYFTGVALRDLILEEKHGVAVDSNGDVLQFGLGFFDPSCRGTSSQTEVDPLSDPEAVAASFIPFAEQKSPKARSDRKPITNKESLPESELNKKALAPIKTLVGKNIIKVHATDSKVFALSKDGNVYVFSASITEQQKIKSGDWNKNPLKLFGLFNGKQIDHEKISSHLISKDNTRKQGLPSGEKISQIAGGTNHLLALTNKGRVLSLPLDERGNLFGQLGSRKTLLNSPTTSGSSSGNIVEVDLEPRMLSNPTETKALDPTSMLPEWALPTPEVMKIATARAEAAALAASGGKSSRSSPSSKSASSSSASSSTLNIPPSPTPITEPPSSIRFCTSFREIPSLRGIEISEIACGREHSAALTPDGKVLAWGRNTHGQCGLGAQVTLECIPTPSEVNLTRSFPATSSEIKVSQIFLGADNSYFVTSRREGPLNLDSEEYSKKSQAALLLASGTKIDVLACGKGQWGGLGNAMWSQINGQPSKVKTVSSLMEFSESTLTSHPVPIYDISVGRPGNVALTLDTVEKQGHYAFGRDVMVFGFNAAFNLGNGKRSNLAIPQHLPPLPRQVEITVEEQKKLSNNPNMSGTVEIPLRIEDEKKTKQLREADINSGVLTHMPHKRLQLASLTPSVSLVPEEYSNNQLNSERKGVEKKKVQVEERILSGASSMAVWFKATA